MNQRTRRQFLAVTGAVGLGAAAGCLGSDDDPDEGDDESANGDDNPTDDSGGSETAPAAEGTNLGDITIDNLHDEPHTVDVQVKIDDTTQAWVDKDLEARQGSVELDRAWDTDGATFTVLVRLDSDQFIEVRPEDWNDPGCVSLFVVIDGTGDLRIAGDTTGGYCAQ